MMKKMILAFAFMFAVVGVSYAQIDMDAVNKNVQASIAKADELLLKKERQAAADELSKTAKGLYEQAKSAQEAGNLALTGLAQELELAARRVKDGAQDSLEQLKKFSDYQMNVAYHMAEAEAKVGKKDYKDAQAELGHVSSYLQEVANGAGQSTRDDMINAKKDVDNLVATLAESAGGVASVTGGAIRHMEDHLEALFNQKGDNSKDIK